MCKIILVDYMASKMIECIATLFHPAFTGTKLDRSSSCYKCDECDNKVDNKVIFEILQQLLLNWWWHAPLNHQITAVKGILPG